MVDSVNTSGVAAADRHGEDRLADRLLRTALDRLAEQPAERLSLRQLATEVGVSHQGPYVHFGSRRQFLAAVAGIGLQEAAEHATAAVAQSGVDPQRRLHALVDAYLAFIRDQPHVHDLAYGPVVAKSDHPLLQAGAIAYWNLLHDVVAACQPAGTTEAMVLRRCAVAWSTVYGVARLFAFRQIPVSVPAAVDELIHEAVGDLYQAWRTTPAAEGSGGES